jgi:hypothetical protein
MEWAIGNLGLFRLRCREINNEQHYTRACLGRGVELNNRKQQKTTKEKRTANGQ